ncbi:MAG: DUF3035 domain-containing protein [Proteobacteria bacterium]|nr:DUF3035 domain-containing protein [Pseudomonadota bacterium]
MTAAKTSSAGRLARLAGAAAAGFALLLGGCSAVKNTFSVERDAPDEFTVVSRAPLSLPPEFNLRPPRPGEPRPQEGSVRDEARQALFGAGAPTARARADGRFSAGENAVLDLSGARNAEADIRQLVDRESLALADRGRSFADRLIFWQKPEPPGMVVDPSKEAQRIRQNAALGRPLTEGETPVIQRKKRGWLEGIF